jgi:hypothetical protein
VDSAVQIVEGLGDFLGYNGVRRYFFGASNPAELRGTGGLIGAYAILTAHQGKLSFSDFRPVQELGTPPPEQIPPPNDDYARRYPGSWAFWLNINLTPDYPSTATAIESLYEHVEGVTLDGVVVADPFALSSLLGVTGPVPVPALGRTISEEDAVSVLANEAFITLADAAERKAILGDAAKAAFETFLQGTGSPQQALPALLRSASDGHLKIHSTDAAMQAGLAGVELGGALRSPEGDYLGVAFNNNGGNKIDYYAQHSVRYAVRLGAGGTAESTATVAIRNDAPGSGLPAYVIGPFPGVSEAGENMSTVSLYLRPETRPLEAAVNGLAADPNLDSELGHVVVENLVETAAGHTGSVTYRLGTRRTWTGSSSRGTYRLLVQTQPRINPMRVQIDVQSPEGTEIVWTSVPMEVTGNRARWTGTVPAAEAFEIRFEKPLLPKLLDTVVDFLDRPVVTF